MVAMLKESNLTCPCLTVIQPGSTPLTIRLPVYLSKVVESVDKMTEQAFKKNWDDISFNLP